MIVPKENRNSVLLKAGVPEKLLDAINEPFGFTDFEYVAKFPDGFYFYLDTIWQDYEILSDYDITPIYEGSNSDTYFVLLSKGNERRFVHFELEQDEIYDDYGSDFALMFADLLISYYEFMDEMSIDTLIEYGQRMGFVQSKKLFKELETADKNGLRRTFEMDQAWRDKHLPQIIS